MTRRGSTPEPAAPDGIPGDEIVGGSARVSLRRAELYRLVQAGYYAGTLVVWLGLGAAGVRFAPSIVGGLVQLSQALTRTSLALERVNVDTTETRAELRETRAELREARAEQRAQGARLEALLQGCGRR